MHGRGARSEEQSVSPYSRILCAVVPWRQSGRCEFRDVPAVQYSSRERRISVRNLSGVARAHYIAPGATSYIVVIVWATRAGVGRDEVLPLGRRHAATRAVSILSETVGTQEQTGLSHCAHARRMSIPWSMVVAERPFSIGSAVDAASLKLPVQLSLVGRRGSRFCLYLSPCRTATPFPPISHIPIYDVCHE